MTNPKDDLASETPRKSQSHWYKRRIQDEELQRQLARGEELPPEPARSDAQRTLGSFPDTPPSGHSSTDPLPSAIVGTPYSIIPTALPKPPPEGDGEPSIEEASGGEVRPEAIEDADRSFPRAVKSDASNAVTEITSSVSSATEAGGQPMTVSGDDLRTQPMAMLERAARGARFVLSIRGRLLAELGPANRAPAGATPVDVKSVRSQRSRLLKEAERGAFFLVCKDGQPVASLGPPPTDATIPKGSLSAEQVRKLRLVDSISEAELRDLLNLRERFRRELNDTSPPRS